MKTKFRTLFWSVLFSILLLTLFYTRAVNLDWGLPYPFHPDERNMAVAVQGMGCRNLTAPVEECFNPHFFAYGQLPLYIAYGLLALAQTKGAHLISFTDATIALRVLSVLSSLATVYVGYLLFKRLNRDVFTTGKKRWKNAYRLFFLLSFIFSPVLIQFAHFGTTESFLMLLSTLLVYLGTMYIQSDISLKNYVLWSGIVLGLAIGAKISSLSFAVIPFISVMLRIKGQEIESKKDRVRMFFESLVLLGVVSAIVAVISSPYSIIKLSDFLSSLQYESSVATGSMRVFYTRQYEYSLPVIFQLIKILPFALGEVVVAAALIGLLAPPRNKEHIALRLSVVTLFLLNAFMYAKWTRFIAPIYPLILLIAVRAVLTGVRKLFQSVKPMQYLALALYSFFLIGFTIQGYAFLSVYTTRDSRFQASDWLYDTVKENEVVLSETANVVDLPIDEHETGVKEFKGRTISFNFYDLDTDVNLQQQLDTYLASADYIIVPSRRIYMNHSCVVNPLSNILSYDKKRCQKLQASYPLLNKYYDKLFSGALGYTEVARFTSYPTIPLISGHSLVFPDEMAEETWTVFDHPVIRIFKKSALPYYSESKRS